MSFSEIVNSAIDKIPFVIGIIRDIISKGLSAVHLSGANLFVFGAISIFLAYLFLKQWITGSLWAKFSTLLNLILLSIIFYLLLTRVA